MLKCFLLITLVATIAAVPLRASSNGAYKLIMLPEAAQSEGAMCLDGTPYGFYFSPATNPQFASTWQVFFQGGGWCYNELDCYFRSLGDLGSSKNWAKSMDADGISSSDCKLNPDFCQANRVYLTYCDGNSFSGRRTDPLNVNGSNVWFRGHNNLNAAFAKMLTLGLDKAENVLLTGCSAGGLSTFLHADYFGQLIKAHAPSVKKYRAAPLSGYFLDHLTVEGKAIYEEEIKKVYELSNATWGMNDKCVESKSPAERFKCNFAVDTYDHIVTPLFVINSAIDSWQAACIYLAEPVVDEEHSRNNGNCSAVPGWGSCASSGKCTPEQKKGFDQYAVDYMTDAMKSPSFKRDGNGGFIHMCYTHCPATWNAYGSFKLNGVSMQQAFSAWWTSKENSPAAEHTYAPCTGGKCTASC